MIEFKRFISFVGKEFNHILRDKRTLLVLLVMPIVMILLFGFALSTEIKNVKVAFYNPSVDAATTRIISQIDASEYFTIVKKITDKNKIENVFLNNTADIVLVFEDNFYHRMVHDHDASIQLIIDGTNTNIASIATFYLSSIIGSYQKEVTEEQMQNSIGTASQASMPPIHINTSTRMLYNPQMRSAFNFVPGVMGMILMLVCAMMTSVSIVREKQRGTMEVLLVSPVKPVSIILAKTIPYFVISSINLATIIFLSVFLLKVPISGSLLWLVLVSLLFITVSLSLGILISTLVSQQEVAILISGMVLMLPTMMLSGMLFPIEGMPKFLQYCSYVVPARWYIDSVKILMIQGLGIKYCLNPILILLGFQAAIVCLTLIKFKDRL